MEMNQEGLTGAIDAENLRVLLAGLMAMERMLVKSRQAQQTVIRHPSSYVILRRCLAGLA